jgi:PKD repeat protein
MREMKINSKLIAAGLGALASLALAGTARAEVALSELMDLGAGFTDVSFSRVEVNRRTSRVSLTATVDNDSTDTIRTPAYLGIEDIDRAGVSVLEPDGVSEEGIPFFQLGDEPVPPGESVSVRVAFDVPARMRFSFTPRVYGETTPEDARRFPRADADARPDSGLPPLEVELIGTGSDEDGEIVLYEWDFEDDGEYDYSSADSGSTMHTYELPGRYTAVLRVTDDEGLHDRDEVTVRVYETDDIPPTVTITPADGSTIETTTPVITVAYSDDDSGVVTSTLRILLDGQDITGAFTITPTQATYTANLTIAPHRIEASISDERDNLGQATSDFTVFIPGFQALPDCSPTTGVTPLTVTFRSRGEFQGGSIVRYRWDFEGDGRFDTSDSVARDYQRTIDDAGIVNAVLQVTNNLGQTASATCTIEVGGNVPTASANAAPSNGAIPLDVDFTCTGNDPDGTIVQYEWDFEGDGTFDFSSPTTGNVMHTYDQEGTFIAVCRVTDNDGQSALARTTTTSIRPGPPGSPSVEATAAPTEGDAPLDVALDGAAIDDGQIVQWEWDFEGDGTFDYTSATSPATTHTYAAGGVFPATLRVTDDDGNTGIDTVGVTVNLTANLTIPDDTFDPVAGETVNVRTTVSAGVPVRVLIKDAEGNVVRTLVDEFRPDGTYDDPWDGRSDPADPSDPTDNGQLLPQGVYYSILEYDFSGETMVVDLTNASVSERYNPPRNSLPRSFSPFDDDLLTINFTVPANRGASEIQAFVGLFNTDTRFITLLDREPLGVGPHTIHWDGIDTQLNLAEPPPGDQFLFGIFGFTLPANAIMLQSAPVISNVSVDPNYFDPATPDFLTPDNPVATVTYDLDKMADVSLTVTNLSTGVVLAEVQQPGASQGADLTIAWDGHAQDDGLFADAGDYRLALQATDTTGNTSIVRYALVRVFY